MNKICETCDTRLRLGICKGKDGDFRYCFRRMGSLNGLEITITPFNTLDELYEKCRWLNGGEHPDNGYIKKQLYLDNVPYADDEHMRVLYGLHKKEEDLDEKIECGWVRKIGFVIC